MKDLEGKEITNETIVKLFVGANYSGCMIKESINIADMGIDVNECRDLEHLEDLLLEFHEQWVYENIGTGFHY